LVGAGVKSADSRNRRSDSIPKQYSPLHAAQEVSELTRCERWAELFPNSGISLAGRLITRMQFGRIADIRSGGLSAAAKRRVMDVGDEHITLGWEVDYGSWGSAPTATQFS
jgi:hypothetical protein